MPITLNPANVDERIIRARAQRLGVTVEKLFEPFVNEIVRQEVIDEDPVMSIRPQVAKIEERAAAAAAARGGA